MWTLEIFKLHVELTFMIHLIFLLGSTNIYQGTINGYILGCFSLNTFLLASQCFFGFFLMYLKVKRSFHAVAVTGGGKSSLGVGKGETALIKSSENENIFQSIIFLKLKSIPCSLMPCEGQAASL